MLNIRDVHNIHRKSAGIFFQYKRGKNAETNERGPTRRSLRVEGVRDFVRGNIESQKRPNIAAVCMCVSPSIR